MNILFDLNPLAQAVWQISLAFFGTAILVAVWRYVLKSHVYGVWQKSGNTTRTLQLVSERMRGLYTSFKWVLKIATYFGMQFGFMSFIATAAVYLFSLPVLVGSFMFSLLAFSISLFSGFNALEWIQSLTGSQLLAIAIPLTFVTGLFSLIVARTIRLSSCTRFIREYSLVTFAVSGTIAGISWWWWSKDIAASCWAIVAIVVGTYALYLTITDLLNRKWGTDIVASAALIFALFQAEYLAAAIIALMTASGKALEEFGFHRATRALKKLIDRSPTFAWRIHEGKGDEKVPVAEINKDDLVRIHPGDIIPVDGVVESGQAECDTSSVTGESVPIPVRKGSFVRSGEIILAASVVIRATAKANESTYETIVKSVQDAQQKKAPFIHMADQAAQWFTITTILMALSTWFLSGDETRVLAVLVVATPCPLLIAAPIAVLSAINRAARSGIVVKSGEALEYMARARAIFFDKTGTLTRGTPVVTEFYSVHHVDAAYVCGVIASLTAHSSHVISRAIASMYQGDPTQVHDVKEIPGRGIMGLVQEKKWYVGNEIFLQEHGIVIPSHERDMLRGDALTVLFGCENSFIGFVRLQDVARQESEDAILKLTNLGLHPIAILTGDNEVHAHALARTVGIKDVRASLTPQEKLEIITKTRNDGIVVMVGDGINDAPALAAADIGISLSGVRGTSISSEAADIVLLRDDISLIPELVDISRRMRNVAWQSIGIGMGLSFCAMIAASLGFISPIAGAFLQEGIDVAVIINALRAYRRV